ncbi:cytochrome b561/polyisoprenoid-binding protein YceI [Loktanella ponticola]|uniref:Cytochrome b561/polyisoprenoid-binding protein YceI n=1 Tax=Yoonia ponticola TaxID=1524255 RepID=A0A7W9EZM3_9RHOB|nr:cytochrome b/b6 domain-containing protein [Yoonia ponticola]MBB5722081.1 cytochrome b561/polyisoprenoid-binding protein YceI [Yoonia ponticola]
MSKSTSYHIVTKSFHWLTALLILAIIPLGMIANDLPFETDAELARKAWVFSIHKTLGVTVFFVALLRILWAVTQAKPGPLHPNRKAETFLAEVIHWVLYISLVAVPLTGWIEHAATSGFAPIWWPFGQSLFFVPQSNAVAGVFAGLHWMFGKLMIASILLHIAGALKHQFVDRDATLRRMWFGRANAPVVAPHVTHFGPRVAALAAFALAGFAAFAFGFLDRHETTVAATALDAVASEWVVQDGEIAITVAQFGSDVSGSFADWTSEISFDPAPADIMGDVTTVISIGSLTLGSVTSEAMGADYFDAETFPTATFTAQIKPDGDSYIADGSVTIKGVTVPVQMPFDLILDGDTAQMTGTVTLERLAFNVGESQTSAANLGFDVIVNISLTAQRGA